MICIYDFIVDYVFLYVICEYFICGVRALKRRFVRVRVVVRIRMRRFGYFLKCNF